MYEVKLNVFEGPLDLLMHLITDQKVDIYNIPIHMITTQYMSYMENLSHVDVNLASEFLVMAATLLEIKSKLLLPDSELDTLSDDLLDDDPRTELVIKLLEFKKYKKASAYFREREETLGTLFYREQSDLTPYFTDIPIEELNSNLEVDLLVEAMKRVLFNLDRLDEHREKFFSKLHREAYSVEDKMAFIDAQVLEKESLLFTDLFPIGTSKPEVIATFLAILELLKIKKISIVQNELFDNILITKKVHQS